MRQVNRKPKSLEMHKAELLANAPQAGSEEALMQQLAQYMDGAVGSDGAFRAPTEEELLKLAGGDPNMVYTGKAGMELRTVLAQRVRIFVPFVCYQVRFGSSLLISMCRRCM